MESNTWSWWDMKASRSHSAVHHFNRLLVVRRFLSDSEIASFPITPLLFPETLRLQEECVPKHCCTFSDIHHKWWFSSQKRCGVGDERLLQRCRSEKLGNTLRWPACNLTTLGTLIVYKAISPRIPTQPSYLSSTLIKSSSNCIKKISYGVAVLSC